MKQFDKNNIFSLRRFCLLNTLNAFKMNERRLDIIDKSKIFRNLNYR